MSGTSLSVGSSSEDPTNHYHSYPNAIADARACLKYQQELLSEDHEIIAEAHYKLSLALEFASVTSQGDEDGAAAAPKEVNQELRDEAVTELAAAIDSTKMKLHNKEVELATLHNPEDNDVSRKQITEMKEIIADMEQRVSFPHTVCMQFLGGSHTLLTRSLNSSSTSAAHP